MSELVVRKIADHFARQGGGEGGFMGWVIRDPRIIWWGLNPHGLVIRDRLPHNACTRAPPCMLADLSWTRGRYNTRQR